MPFSRGSSWSRDQTVSLRSPALADRFFTATWEAHLIFYHMPKFQVDLKTKLLKEAIVLFIWNGSPFQYSSLGNPKNRGTSLATVHGVTKSWTQLSDIGRTDDEAETPILWPPDAKSWLIGKDPDAGKDWGQKKGMTEDEMAGWHHLVDGHGFGWTPGVGDGQGGLACCGSWARKELDTTELLNWTERSD